MCRDEFVFDLVAGHATTLRAPAIRSWTREHEILLGCALLGASKSAAPHQELRRAAECSHDRREARDLSSGRWFAGCHGRSESDTWSPIARRALEDVAGVYHRVVNYGELAEELQSASGIRTRQMIHYWIGDVLGEVSRQCHRNGEPLLSALCVHQDGSIGDGYAIALAEASKVPRPTTSRWPRRRNAFAATAISVLSLADGGRPALTPAIATQRTRRVPPSTGRAANGHRAPAVTSRCRRPGCGDYCN